MNAQPALVFHEEGHRYFLDGVEVPSVTQVLEPLTDYSHVPPAILEHARQIGTAVHRACELLDRDDLVVESLDPRLVGYVAAWRRFKEETGFVIEFNETQVFSRIYHCAGTLDRIGLLRGVAGKPRALVEIKTTADFMPAFGPQTAGYHMMVPESGLMDKRTAAAMRRWAVQLREDGSYRIEQYFDPADLSVFTACLNLFHWRKRHVTK